MKATEHNFPVVLFNVLVQGGSKSLRKLLSRTFCCTCVVSYIVQDDILLNVRFRVVVSCITVLARYLIFLLTNQLNVKLFGF